MSIMKHTPKELNSHTVINNVGIASELDLTVKVRVFCPIISKMLHCI